MSALSRLVVSILTGATPRRNAKSNRNAQRGVQRVLTYRAAVVMLAEHEHKGYRSKTAFRKAMSIDAIYRRDRGRCALCGRHVDRTRTDKWGPSIDHIRPLARGGAHAPENVQLAHKVCNSQKGARWR